MILTANAIIFDEYINVGFLKPFYGLTKASKAIVFYGQHFHYYLELYYFSKTKPSLLKKIHVFFSPPQTVDQRIRPLLERKLLKRKNTALEHTFKIYLNIQLAVAFALLLYLTAFFTNTSSFLKLEIFIFVFLTLINIGAILEKKNFYSAWKYCAYGNFWLF